MTFTDKRGNKIELGSYIIYANTGTIGEVLDMKTDDDGSWVLIQVDELTRLWYNTQYIELTDKKYSRKIKEEKDKALSVDDIKKQIDEHISAELGDDAVGGG